MQRDKNKESVIKKKNKKTTETNTHTNKATAHIVSTARIVPPPGCRPRAPPLSGTPRPPQRPSPGLPRPAAPTPARAGAPPPSAGNKAGPGPPRRACSGLPGGAVPGGGPTAAVRERGPGGTATGPPPAEQCRRRSPAAGWGTEERCEGREGPAEPPPGNNGADTRPGAERESRAQRPTAAAARFGPPCRRSARSSRQYGPTGGSAGVRGAAGARSGADTHGRSGRMKLDLGPPQAARRLPLPLPFTPTTWRPTGDGRRAACREGEAARPRAARPRPWVGPARLGGGSARPGIGSATFLVFPEPGFHRSLVSIPIFTVFPHRWVRSAPHLTAATCLEMCRSPVLLCRPRRAVCQAPLTTSSSRVDICVHFTGI